MPLSDLDAVDWSSLSHAYGPATTTGDELRTLTSDDKEKRSEALAALTASICHQGSVYPATGAAIPYLVGIAGLGSLPGNFRAKVVMLVDWIAEGNVHLERDSPERAHEPWGRMLSRNLRQATPQLLHLVRGNDGTLLRAWAVWAVRTLPATREDLDELKAMLAEEHDPVVKGTMALALDQDDPVLPSLLSPTEDPLVRLCAAAQLIPVATDLNPLLAVAHVSVPHSTRFAELPVASQEDTDSIRLIAARLEIVDRDEQVTWITRWLPDPAWSVPALYAAAAAGESRRSAAPRLIEPVTEVVKHPPAGDPEIQSSAVFALLELGLPGLERVRELVSTLDGNAREVLNRYRSGAESLMTIIAAQLQHLAGPATRAPSDLSATIKAADFRNAWEMEGVKALDELASWGTKAGDQTGVVEEVLDRSRSPLLRIHGAWALARISGATNRAVAVLLGDFQPGLVGCHVAWILGELGPAASAALPVLRAYAARDLRPPDVSALEDDLAARACVAAIARIEAA